MIDSLEKNLISKEEFLRVRALPVLDVDQIGYIGTEKYEFFTVDQSDGLDLNHFELEVVEVLVVL